MTVRTTTLPNGLRVVTESMVDAQSVALSYWVNVGSRDERAGEEGIAHFLEHLLFKGTPEHTSLDIAQWTDVSGCDMNAFTTKESTSFYLRLLEEDAAEGLSLLTEIMCDPAFRPEDVDAERLVVLEEMLMRGDEPADVAYENFALAFYGSHPLGREILGDETLIRRITPDEIRAFFHRRYQPAHVVFAAAGKVDHDQLVNEVDRLWTVNGDALPLDRSAPLPQTGSTYRVMRDCEQTHMVLGFPAPHRHDRRRYIASVLDAVVGGGMSSRLFQEVRERRGLAYSVYSSYGSYEDAADFSIYAGTTPDRSVETLNVIRSELERCIDDICEEEVLRAKRHISKTTRLNLEDPLARMSRIGRSLMMHGEVLSVSEVQSRVDAVTCDEVHELAREIFSHHPTLSVVGPSEHNELTSQGIHSSDSHSKKS